MTVRKAGLYLSPPIAALLEGRDEPLSARIATVAERYTHVVAGHAPDLTEAEWNACRDALNGYWMGDVDSLRLAWATIDDAGRIDGLGAKWRVDAAALAARVRAFDSATLIAFAEAIERWWAAQV